MRYVIQMEVVIESEPNEIAKRERMVMQLMDHVIGWATAHAGTKHPFVTFNGIDPV